MIGVLDFMMWSLGIGLTMIVIFMILAFSDSSDYSWQSVVGTFGATIATTILILNTIIFSFVFDLNATSTVSETPDTVEQIVAVKDNSQIEGKIYLRRGYISETMYYNYLAETSDGGYVSERVATSKATIYIDNNNPRVEWYSNTQTWWVFYQELEPICKIYVPDGAIANDYSIDLE